MDKQVQKVLDKLQVIVNDFVAQFDLTAQLGTDFGYYWYDEVVEYAMSRSLSPTMVAEYHRQLIPKEVVQKSLEEFCSFLKELKDK